MNFNSLLSILKLKPSDCFNRVFANSENPALLLSFSGEILNCNKALLDFYQLTLSQIINHNYFQICAKKQIGPVFTSISEILQNISKTTVSNEINDTYETKIMLWSVYLIGENNENICLEGKNITAYTNSMVMSQQIQNSIIDLFPNHFIFWKNKNSVYLGCNKAFATSLRFNSPQDVIGKTDYDFPVKKEDSDAYIATDREVMLSRKPKLNFEEPQTLVNGETRLLLASKVPLFNDQGEVYGVLGICSDITGQKLNEYQLIETNKKLEQSYKVKSEFIRNISHDIRTPLSGIQQTLHAFAEGKISEEEMPEYAFAAWQASNKLMELFNQVIDVSVKENFEFEDQEIKFDLYKLLQDLQETYKVVEKHKNVELEIDCFGNKIPRYLIGKNLRLHRILINLLGNAFKFTEKGNVKLVVNKMGETTDKIILSFSVIDTGIGIPKAMQQIIFEPFTRLSPSFQGQYRGSGLGLHMVKDYVEKMRGEIKVESEEGKGSKFTCILPFKRVNAEDQDDAEMADTELLRFPKSYSKFEIESEQRFKDNNIVKEFNILLVEDDLLARNIGALLLRNSGYHVDLAKTGEEAIQLSEKKCYDIIFMDIGLPGIDGIEATNLIRKNKNNSCRDSSIFALTAHADSEIFRQCMDAGIKEVLVKPLSVEKIQKLNSILMPIDYWKTDKRIIDFDLWKSRVGGNNEMVENLFHLFAQDISSNKLTIIQAYDMSDFARLKAVSHKINGALKYCGLPRLEKAISAVEEAAKNHDLIKIKQWYQETIDALDEAQKIYNSWSGKHPKEIDLGNIGILSRF